MNGEIDRQEKILARLGEWVRAADTRFPPLAAMNTAMMGIFAALAPGVSKWTPELISSGSIAASLLGTSLVFLALAVFPRTKGPPHSIIYFEGIRSRTSESYHATINELTETNYLADLIEQSHRNAEIAHVKFRYVRLAMIAWFSSIVPWSSTLYLLILSQRQGEIPG